MCVAKQLGMNGPHIPGKAICLHMCICVRAVYTRRVSSCVLDVCTSHGARAQTRRYARVCIYVRACTDIHEDAVPPSQQTLEGDQYRGGQLEGR
jgi:hypothetical protein